ncbi:DnaJ family domain-containing protein [Pseudaquabacterium pictum]|uniref:DnaJ homologue subfamily C member 28 conserved domain-containing protein n=1 Tax=Pseudaquabacterium pictum TaxID=2315236 RepID=A0A480AI61_9BURK|nr:DUF1992 domain-containing protein [Rubrivivax pictus]GCL61324.1 hypothetical protein AQPW35_04050 [Rubrivivax pictus]
MFKLDDVKAALLRWRAARRREAATPPDEAGRSEARLQVQVLARRRGGAGPSPRQVDDEIARQIAEAEKRGDLRGAEGYGKPLTEDDGWQQTPDEVRMPFKMLKSAGIVPHEVELIRERAALRQRLAAATTEAETRAAQQALAQVELTLALRMESLRR